MYVIHLIILLNILGVMIDNKRFVLLSHHENFVESKCKWEELINIMVQHADLNVVPYSLKENVMVLIN